MMSQNDLAKIYKSFYGKYILFNDVSEFDNTLEGSILEISKETYDNLDNYSSHIAEFNFFRRKVEELKINYKSLLECEQKWVDLILLSEGHEVNNFHEPTFIDFNRLITNFVVSFKTLIDDLILKRKFPSIFGKDSAEVKEFKLKTNHWYNNYFEYRFLMRLRDFAVHYDFPINSVKFNYDIDVKRDKVKELKIDTCFVKNHLLSNSEFKSKLNIDLILYNDKFPVFSLVKNIDFIFDEILKTIIEISKNRYVEAALVMNRHYNSIPDPKSVSFGVIEEIENEYSPKTKIFNKEVIDYILEVQKIISQKDI